MKILIATDSFKGSLTSREAGEAVKIGILRAIPDADVTVKTIADGGEGTLEAFDGTEQTATVSDPLGRKIIAKYLITKDNIAIIESAAACGLTLLTDGERDPMKTTTYGVGELILDAAQKGCRKFIIGLGGSATNDCGAGMLAALGFGILDAEKNPVSFGAAGLCNVEFISDENVPDFIKHSEFYAACDVKNPLCGENGCSAVFAPQKGASLSSIKTMDEDIHNFAEKSKQIIPEADENAEGAGAAGGLGFAVKYFLGGKLESGINLIIRLTGIEQLIKTADIVVTGEGCLDGQSVMGKVPFGIGMTCKKYGKPCIALGGSAKPAARELNNCGITAFFSSMQVPCKKIEAFRHAGENLELTAEQVFRVIAHNL